MGSTFFRRINRGGARESNADGAFCGRRGTIRNPVAAESVQSDRLRPLCGEFVRTAAARIVSAAQDRPALVPTLITTSRAQAVCTNPRSSVAHSRRRPHVAAAGASSMRSVTRRPVDGCDGAAWQLSRPRWSCAERESSSAGVSLALAPRPAPIDSSKRPSRLHRSAARARCGHGVPVIVAAWRLAQPRHSRLVRSRTRAKRRWACSQAVWQRRGARAPPAAPPLP
jgi:hypothetical protein